MYSKTHAVHQSYQLFHTNQYKKQFEEVLVKLSTVSRISFNLCIHESTGVGNNR